MLWSGVWDIRILWLIIRVWFPSFKFGVALLNIAYKVVFISVYLCLCAWICLFVWKFGLVWFLTASWFLASWWRTCIDFLCSLFCFFFLCFWVHDFKREWRLLVYILPLIALLEVYWISVFGGFWHCLFVLKCFSEKVQFFHVR